jgi:hypothetical protein
MSFSTRRIAIFVAAAVAVIAIAGFAAMHFLMSPPADLDLTRSNPENSAQVGGSGIEL